VVYGIKFKVKRNGLYSSLKGLGMRVRELGFGVLAYM
jgi:hypothetical protein